MTVFFNFSFQVYRKVKLNPKGLEAGIKIVTNHPKKNIKIITDKQKKLTV